MSARYDLKPRARPPSFMDAPEAIGDRMREIQRAEDRKPLDPLNPEGKER